MLAAGVGVQPFDGGDAVVHEGVQVGVAGHLDFLWLRECGHGEGGVVGAWRLFWLLGTDQNYPQWALATI